ncbi:MAG: cysteine desulfurase [Candidatus Aenigmarchaeota archaeon]|nr:cysteine desulfurase [Candidatus Aenigmarchaeota archaeon]
MSRVIYLDNAETTKIDPEVLKVVDKYSSEVYGLPSATEYGEALGMQIRKDIEQAKETIAKAINAEPEEIVFTSDEVENDNLAVKGVCFANPKKMHIITSKIERKSLLDIFRSLEAIGCFKTTYLDVDKEGFVSPEDVEKAITDKTVLVALHHVNHEIGTIQDIERIGETCKRRNVIFYVDATQSFLKVPVNVKKMGIDILSISADKIHGPKGVAALCVRNGLKLQRLFEGGESKDIVRPGYTNTPGVMGFAKAVKIYNKKANERMKKMRDYLIDELLKINDTHLNGPDGDKRVCNNVNITFKYVEGEALLLYLSLKGIVATTGSACFSSTLKPSHVIMALGSRHEDAHGSLRLTLSKFNTGNEMKETVKSIREVVGRLREISPLG